LAKAPFIATQSRPAVRRLAPVLAVLLVIGCSNPSPLAKRVRLQGELLVATRNSPTSYYEGPRGFAGLEHDLIQAFAEQLGVRPRFLVANSVEQALDWVAEGSAHVAAAGVVVTHSRAKRFRFAPSYQEITPQVVYRKGRTRPRTIEDLVRGTLEVAANSSQEELLIRLKRDHPTLTWARNHEANSEQLLYLVNEDVIEYTIADSNEVALNRRYYPALTPAFDLGEANELAWAFRRSEDNSLLLAATKFLTTLRKTGQLEQLVERYYGHLNRLNFVDTRTFQRHVEDRLPTLLPYFKESADTAGIDWRLLAAIGYQESHWDAQAVSPTGVRGIMMLTRATAKRVGVNDRKDPKQSILGGAHYIRLLKDKMPDRIPHPDRLWLALAGYNVGFGHLEDARILTERQGADPDKWSEVKQRLPLLSVEKWYKDTRHGYARGREPVAYVDAVRNFYDLLVWMYPEPENEQKSPALGISANAL